MAYTDGALTTHNIGLMLKIIGKDVRNQGEMVPQQVDRYITVHQQDQSIDWLYNTLIKSIEV